MYIDAALSQSHKSLPPSCNEARGGATVRKILERSTLHGIFMKFCLVFAGATNFTTMPPQLLEMLLDLFCGWLQSRVIEKGNKVMRDSETRENASKAFRISVTLAVVVAVFAIIGSSPFSRRT